MPTGEQSSRLASHVDPLLAALTPLWIVFPTPASLIAAQIVACALSAFPLYWLARRHVAESVACILTLAYLSYPWLAWAALDAIHPATLAIPLFLLAVYYLDSDRLVPFAIIASAAALAGELVGLAIASLGLWYWLSKGRRRAGLTIAACGVAWTTICLEIIIPHYSGGESQYYDLYTAVGGSPLGVIGTAATDPGALLGELVTRRDAAYVAALGLPLAGMFLLSPLLLLPAAPQFAANTLSSVTGHADPRFHTISVLVPFLWAATVFGLARLSPQRSMLAAVLILALSLGGFVALGPHAGSRAYAPSDWYHGDPPAGHIEAIRDAVSLVPPNAPVAATAKAGSQLSARRYFYSVPTLGRADWVVVDTLDPWVPAWQTEPRRSMIGSFRPDAIRRTVDRLAASNQWLLAFRQNGVYVFRRTQM